MMEDDDASRLYMPPDPSLSEYDDLIEYAIGRKAGVLKTALFLPANGFDNSAQKEAVQRNGFVDLDKDRFRHVHIVEAIEKAVGGILKRLAKLQDKIFQGYTRASSVSSNTSKCLRRLFCPGATAPGHQAAAADRRPREQARVSVSR